MAHIPTVQTYNEFEHSGGETVVFQKCDQENKALSKQYQCMDDKIMQTLRETIRQRDVSINATDAKFFEQPNLEVEFWSPYTVYPSGSQVNMKMFCTSLKPILFEGNSRKYQNLDFESSVSLESIIDHFNEKDPACVVLYGEHGSGCTTLQRKVCDTLLERNCMKQSEILGLRVRAGCSEQSLCNFLSEIAKDRQDKDTASLLLQSSESSAKLRKKNLAAKAFISSNFKLVCIDDGWSDGGLVWSHLSQLLAKMKVHVIVVSTKKEAPHVQSKLTEHSVLSVELKGIGRNSFKQFLRNRLPHWTLSDDELLRISTMLNGNPTSLKILANALNEFKLPLNSFDCALLSYSKPLNKDESSSVLMVLHFVFQHLPVVAKQVLHQLCQLREPLPLRTRVSEEIGKLVRLGLVDTEAIGEDKRTNKGMYSISVACCIQLSSLQLIDTSDNNGHSPEAAFHLWYGLLSEKLCKLVNDAERNAWPFVPENWQYTTNVGAEERNNIKELITATNLFAPHLTEQDILKECLFQAVKAKMYSTVAALVFVTDRFSYWQGISHRTLQFVEYLRTNSPGTAIAPQLLIREVRVKKNAGDFHGAERALDELLLKKSQVGEWVYKQEHDYQLVCAVCLQIKADIQYNLGKLVQGAKLLIKSIILFSTLPIPDTKGIASSLAILANCLEQMSLSEYTLLAKKYGLTADHPLEQAYYCSYESAQRSQYTALFYARHKCCAAQYMLRYSQLIGDELQKLECLHIAAEDFKESIQAHTDLQSLTSREEFFIFVCAVYKLSITYKEMAALLRGSTLSDQQAQLIRNIECLSMALYEHYWLCTGTILLDKEIVKVISDCLGISKLKPFCDKAGLNVGHRVHSVTDKLKETWERMASKSDTSDIVSAVIHSSQVNSGKNASDLGFTVDRCCDDDVIMETVDRSRAVAMRTVDRSVVTQNLENDAVHFPCEGFQELNLGHSDSGLHAAIVARYDFPSKKWRWDTTLVCVGDLLELAKGKEGRQRNPFMVEFIHQEDPSAKYLGKSYKEFQNVQQYEQDVVCQMTARHYAMLFNQEMNRAGVNVGHLEFLPVVLLRLVNKNGSWGSVYNVERYMAGEYVKLSDNLNPVTKLGLVSDLVLAFSHFTYQASNQELIIVDIQGWIPSSNQTGCTFLTDPQIHSEIYAFGTGNFGQKGFERFWNVMHADCNDLCKKLQLVRPNATKSA